MAELNEGIATIEPGSVLEDLYGRLLNGMGQASQDKLPDFTGPDYVTTNPDGSQTADEGKINKVILEQGEISRKNAAFLLADSIIKSLGAGSDGGVKGGVSIKGDSMLGQLNTLYGFTAGDNNIKILDVYQTENDDPTLRKSMVDIIGQLNLQEHGLYINGANVISYSGKALSIDAPLINLNKDVICSGSITLGDVVIDKTGVWYKNLEFYHSGNSNIETVNWTMNNSNVHGKLIVVGEAELQSSLTALNGILIKHGEQPVLETSAGGVKMIGDLNIVSGGIKLDDSYVLHIKNKEVYSLSATGKTLNLGDDETLKMTLQTGLYNATGGYKLISTTGDGNFPGSFQAGHNNETIFQTYRNEYEDQGVVLLDKKKLRFYNTEYGPSFSCQNGDDLIYTGSYNWSSGQMWFTNPVKTLLGYRSYYDENDVRYCALYLEADPAWHSIFQVNNPLLADGYIGIAYSGTYLTNNELYFNRHVHLTAISDGVKHYGNIYAENTIGTEQFSSGLAGSGWRIYSKGNGNYNATFDEVTIRKRARFYELEIQKHSVTNGTLWISDSCRGDHVEEL